MTGDFEITLEKVQYRDYLTILKKDSGHETDFCEKCSHFRKNEIPMKPSTAFFKVTL
jgi:hypothetical protein